MSDLTAQDQLLKQQENIQIPLLPQLDKPSSSILPRPTSYSSINQQPGTPTQYSSRLSSPNITNNKTYDYDILSPSRRNSNNINNNAHSNHLSLLSSFGDEQLHDLLSREYVDKPMTHIRPLHTTITTNNQDNKDKLYISQKKMKNKSKNNVIPSNHTNNLDLTYDVTPSSSAREEMDNDNSKLISNNFGKGVSMSDEELISLLQKPPKTISFMRTKSSFQEFLKGISKQRMLFLLEKAYNDIEDEAEKQNKISKRLDLLKEVLC
eukprot:gene9978-13423_t